jgi:predicted O-methyltransferase YrrM
MGTSALVFAANCPEATVYTLDLPDVPPEYIARRQYKSRPEGERVVELFGDSLQFDFSPYEGAMDVVYVDGAHDWQTVEADTQNALKMVRRDGLIIWHDYGRRGCDVTDYLETLDRELGGALRWVRGTSLAVCCGLPTLGEGCYNQGHDAQERDHDACRAEGSHR